MRHRYLTIVSIGSEYEYMTYHSLYVEVTNASMLYDRDARLGVKVPITGTPGRIYCGEKVRKESCRAKTLYQALDIGF